MTEAISSEAGSLSRPGEVPRAAAETPARVVLVTGLSGAGRSSALKAFEDLGYEAVDNLPLSLLPSLVRPGDSLTRPLAIGTDIRARDFAVEPLLCEHDRLLGERGVRVSLLFIDCEDEVLQRRFTETRRRHPLAADRPIADGIRRERELLRKVHDRADLVLDTTNMTLADLKRVLQGQFGRARDATLAIAVVSFAYRFGLPREADIVFDVRFLANPHYVAELSQLGGRDPRIVHYVTADPSFEPFVAGIKAWLGPLLPQYDREGKSYLTIAIGCTGGRHRSVVVSEHLAAWLAGLGQHVSLLHRDLERPRNG